MSTIDTEAAAHNEMSAVQHVKKERGFLARVIISCIPHSPKSADRITNRLVYGACLVVPLTFVISYYHSQGHAQPSFGFIWAIPWVVSMLWFGFQMLCLAFSSQQSVEEISYKEILICFLAPIVCIGVLIVFVMLWILRDYSFGPFQWNMMFAALLATGLNAGIGGAVRFALKGRLFGNLTGGNSSNN
jgi:hypothetical protein